MPLMYSPTQVQGAMMPHKTVQKMCFTAELIVAGTDVGNGKVRVDHLFYAASPTTKIGHTIDIPSIPKHSKIINGIFSRNQDDPPIATKQLILFLIMGKDKKLVPIDLYGSGSQGLFWYDNESCYGYSQRFNPGPYILKRSRPSTSRGRIPHGKDAMWEQIKIGLEQRSLWEAAKAIKDPAKRASQMTKYLLPHTAPNGYASAVNYERKSAKSVLRRYPLSFMC